MSPPINDINKPLPASLTSPLKSRLSLQFGRYAGWRVGVLIAIVAVSLVLVTNLIVTIWACVTYSVFDGLGMIYEGSCFHTKTLSLWIHFAIKSLSTLALSGSNYTQQCLMSPTRAEVNRAHLQRKWLDIGVPSVRNIWSVDRLCVTDGFDYRYNCAVFSTISVNKYVVAIVPENAYSEPPPPILEASYADKWKALIEESRGWISLPPIDCVKAYNTLLQSHYGNIVLVTYGENKTEGLLRGLQDVPDAITPQQWIVCPLVDSCFNETSRIKDIISAGKWTFDDGKGRNSTVKECRAEATPEVCVITGTAGLLSLAFDSTTGITSFHDMWSQGFGLVNTKFIVTMFGNNMPFAFAVLLANAPQLILSFLYLLYNSLFTNMLLGKEWNNYARFRKTLRVTRPCGDQRGTYRLNLPYRYGVPLMILSALLHWTASQSLFLARIKIDNRSFLQSTENKKYELISTAGFSPLALSIALLLGVLTVIAVLLCGCRVYPYDMPIPGSCSAAISAACHSIKMYEWEREQLVLKPLQWGDVGVEDVGVRHLTFSDDAVERPREYELYAGNGCFV
ncbi:hypothetical protein K440DRAFT_639945 [Wilcoxina mikolae CBS 423.85]|nr:hypothetical protein K440DRAFT_639945 [Wilcoxina mikolae CBS 423.85]